MNCRRKATITELRLRFCQPKCCHVLSLPHIVTMNACRQYSRLLLFWKCNVTEMCLGATMAPSRKDIMKSSELAKHAPDAQDITRSNVSKWNASLYLQQVRHVNVMIGNYGSIAVKIDHREIVELGRIANRRMDAQQRKEMTSAVFSFDYDGESNSQAMRVALGWTEMQKLTHVAIEPHLKFEFSQGDRRRGQLRYLKVS
ncbi:hypothetical protein PHSY_005537 [Pseudozyma hubeiensis SY62]|uniref:Uncharacterized protein n=1 Tax=Pseudozyma hubeiensis (strain SY62) TaxID=1305764 RepID=R9P9C5_PSEHS|nr:hypothetical protein PHSY_005537 [Pseudozyma hubeiensis SY62]GAC97949.1 hypothetical protein PHSY_005537 [Pseudozyma hubeiensis SY62]